MQLEDYLTVATEDEILLAGTRVGLEVIVKQYLAGEMPEQIALDYSLSPEQVYAAITYYLRNRASVDAYCARLEAWSRRVRAESVDRPVPLVVQRLRDLRRRQSAA